MGKALGHRERMLRSIAYKDIDRLPFFFRADNVIKNKIKARYLLQNDIDIINFYDADAIQIVIPLKSGSNLEPDENGEYYDVYGNKIRRIQCGDNYTEKVIKPILSDAVKIEDIYRINWPGSSIINMDESIIQAEQARETGLAVYGGAWASIFTHPRNMMGEEAFLLTMFDNPEMIKKIVERTTDFFIELNEAYFSKCSKFLDIFYLGSDFGTQNSLFISKDMFCRFFKPSLKRLVQHAKGFGLKVMFHTCGAVSEIIPELIDCGVDILDPVQVSAANMAPALLAGRYKNKIVFHGGISTQTTLPSGTPEDVQRTIIDTVKELGPLGYIAAPDQEMIGDISLENIEIMFTTIKEIKL